MLGKNGKYACDRTRPSSQNKVSSSFEHRHRHFDALLNTGCETGRYDYWTGKVMRAHQQSQDTYISTDRSPGSSMLKCMCALKLEGSNFKVLTSFSKFLSLGSQCIEVGPPWIEILDKHSSSMEKKRNQAS